MKKIAYALSLIILLTTLSGCTGVEDEEVKDPPEFIYVQYLAFCESCKTLELVYRIPGPNYSFSPQHTVYTWAGNTGDDPISGETKGPDWDKHLGDPWMYMWKSQLYKFNTTGLTQIDLAGYDPNRTSGDITNIEIRVFVNNSEDANSLLLRESGEYNPGCDDIYHPHNIYCRWDRFSGSGDSLVYWLSNDILESR